MKQDTEDARARGAECEFRAARFEYRFTESGPTTKGQFEGYGSVFNNEDDFGDVIVKGAFRQTLIEHDRAGTMPKMLLNHGGMGGFFSSPSPEDLLPIGKWTTMSEDSHGLASKGKLINLDTESGKRIYGAMKENALDGLSIGFKAKDFVRGVKESEPRRTIKQVHLIEVSPVTFPANTLATVSSVKAALESFADLKGAEKLLRDAAGFSKSEATAFIARVMTFGRSDSVLDGETKQMLEALNRRAILLQR